ncbi:MAG TPA: hypothetical protein VK923_17100 [Euzebyales bacterium]|nr:hypothetical protein [Euzebyales bacterium]
MAASLIEAFQSPPDTRIPSDASAAPDRLQAGAVDDLAPTGADDVTDDAAAGSTDQAPTAHPVEPMGDTDRLDAEAPPADDQDVVRARAPDAAEAAGAPPATTGPQARADEPSPAAASLDDAGPITDRFANIPTVPMDRGPSPDVSTEASTDAAGATAAPRTAHGGTPRASARDDGPTAAQAPADAASTTATDSRDTSDAPAWRAALREAGTWTAVAQFTLLFIGMLCVFQVVVLLVVNQFLSQTQTEQAVAADMLAAHAKVATVMLPALVGGAFAAAGFAAWRAHTDPQQHDDAAPLRRWVLGLPVAIWAVIVTATVLLVVVVLGTSSTIAGAQRMTLWAIGACTLLGVACVAAPRGLAAVEDDADLGEPPRANAARR